MVAFCGFPVSRKRPMCRPAGAPDWGWVPIPGVRTPGYMMPSIRDSEWMPSFQDLVGKPAEVTRKRAKERERDAEGFLRHGANLSVRSRRGAETQGRAQRRGGKEAEQAGMPVSLLGEEILESGTGIPACGRAGPPRPGLVWRLVGGVVRK